MQIIGILGQMGAGKDTMADHLRQYGYTRVAFADEMKRIAARLYGFTPKQLWGPSSERNKPDERWPRADGTCLSPREALQLMGTEFGRRAHQDTWVRVTLGIADKLLDPGTRFLCKYIPEVGIYFTSGPGLLSPQRKAVIIPDCRFANEVNAIKQKGGMVVRLKRAGLAVAGIAGHASEEEQRSLPDSLFDLVIDVPEGIEKFHALLDRLRADGKLP